MSDEPENVSGGSAVVSAFREAVAALESARQMLDRRRIPEFDAALRRCAEALSGLRNTATSLQSGPDLFPEMLPAPLSRTAAKNQLQQHYANYRDALARIRRELVAAGYARRIGGRVLLDAARKSVAVTGMALLAMAAVVFVPLSVYRHLQPMTVFEVTGQLFWKSASEAPFTENLSRRFAVQVDGNEAVYVVTLPPASQVVMLRLDPANSAAITGIDITQVELFDEKSAVVADIRARDLMNWSCNNCEKAARDTEGHMFRPSSNDPYLVGPEFEPVQVSKIAVHMRAEARKRFWEWALGLDAGS